MSISNRTNSALCGNDLKLAWRKGPDGTGIGEQELRKEGISMDKMIRKVKHFLDAQKEYKPVLQKIADRYGVPYLWIKADFIWCRIRYGASIYNYISFEFFKLCARERNTFLTDIRSERIIRGLKKPLSPKEKDLLNDKCQTNALFSKLVHREWIDASTADEDQIRAFLQRHDQFIQKPSSKAKGEGVEKKDSRQVLSNFSSFIAEIKNGKWLLEEVVKQHSEMNAVNPTSINTLRVASIRDTAGNVHIVGVSLRGGMMGAVVDNLRAGGVQYPIDIQQEIIARPGVRFNGETGVLFHPGTDHKMIGMRIPNWDSVVAATEEAGKMLPNIRSVGWDFAITEQGCELIEANLSQGVNGMQLDGIGKYPIIKQYL